MIEFTQLKIDNFLSYGKGQVIPLEDQGVIRLEGVNLDEAADSNMAGKSSVIEALVWCLFGKTIRGVKNDSVVNRFSRRNCRVSVYFRINDIEYIVHRYRRHSDYQNSLKLYRGDKSLTFRHVEETQKKLETILGCDFSSFSNSVVFGGTKPFASLTDSEQKKVFESFLHFEQFDQAQRKVKDKIFEVREKLDSLNLAVERKNGEVLAAKERMETLKESKVVFSKDRTETAAVLKRKIRKLRRKLEELPNIPDPSSAIEKWRLRKENSLKEQAAYHQTIIQCRKQKQLLRERIEKRKNFVGKPCPLCGKVISEVTSSFLGHMSEERLNLVRAIKRAKKRCRLATREVNYAEEVVQSLLIKQRRHQNLESGKKHLEERLSSLKEEIRTAVSSRSPFEEQLEEASRRYSKNLSRLLVLEHGRGILKNRLENLQFWEVGFGNRGVKSLVIREALPALNSKLGEYSQSILGGVAELKFLPSKETKKGEERELFHVRYISRKGSGSYLGESAGGRKRVDICVLLCFAWLSRTSNLLLVDELLDGLDRTGQEIVLDILSGLRGTILVISHKRELRSKIGKVWRVTKKDGFSSLEAA